MGKQRLDSLIVAKGLAESRTKAQALIMAGQVVVAGKEGLKPGTALPESAVIKILETPQFVGRGGIKLAHALDQFQIDVSGKVVGDIGASTGGFTDCLLQWGARRVYAVDVGYGQLDYRLRKDPRVVVLERVNARYQIPVSEKIALATIDVSFISVQKIIPSVATLMERSGYFIVLIKPQFEAERSEVGRGGVIKDSQLHATVLGRFCRWAVANSLHLKGLVPSPILGSSGNQEFLLLLELT
ncbi:TlyA family RNA methyltransferase [Chloroflexota bacterium]